MGMRKSSVIAIMAALSVSSCGSGENNPTENAVKVPEKVSDADPQPVSFPEPETVSAPKEIEVAAEESEEDTLTGPQRNAVRSAEQYLAMTGFSRAGLIQQPSSDAGDGYSVADATVAVDSLSVDWNENAERSARQYLDMTGFSCDGLVEQLSSSAGDRYTVAEATYGARQAGACRRSAKPPSSAGSRDIAPAVPS
jgi:hypothetical protein